MTAYFKHTSSMKACTLAGKDSAVVSSVRYLKFDKNDIPSDIRVSSTNNYQFILDHNANASFALVGSTSIRKSGSSTSETIFQFYDETNSTYIGTRGSLASNSGTSLTDQEEKNPCYRTAAVAVILASDFSGADITVSLREVSSTGTIDYAFEPTGFENHSGFPCLQIYQSK